jgi:spermidine synthase/MFS family permease
MSQDGPQALPHALAVVLVTATSGSVLVLEILAGRLLAPYVGVNLETYTAIIGTILAGIALGAWAGGVASDRWDPRMLIPILLTFGGALAIASIPIVRALGGDPGPGGTNAPSVILALWGFGPSAAVLSAVPPAVVKLQLRDLDRTGSTVGRLSAWGTAGAIAGTFLAGYVLVAFAAVTTLIVVVGVLLIVAGIAMWFARGVTDPTVMLSAGGLAALSLVGVAATSTPCDVQSAYYCISVETDPDRPSGRVLVLDDLRHSYVDLDDPTFLDFWYVRRIVDAIDEFAPPGPIDVIALGGGAMTVPRWVDATRPGARQTVLEIDPDLVDLVEEEFGLPGAAIVTGDGRVALRDLAADTADVVIGDAFGSRSVPWHLATREFMADVARVLRPDGVYVANVIDGGDESFLRAEAATLSTEFAHVGVMRGQSVVDGFVGNSVVVASDAELDLAAWDDRRAARGDDGELVLEPGYLDGALVLTDDFAPVDQLIVGTR